MSTIILESIIEQLAHPMANIGVNHVNTPHSELILLSIKTTNNTDQFIVIPNGFKKHGLFFK
ncbi:MAG: hypothetical protein R2827_08325 [Bdellovibrionales bacterium]